MGIKRFFSLAVLAASVLSASSVRAYETDTHFYATYAMARYAGIDHEIASVIASSAQWPDETEILASPMVAELGVGTKMRRLFHFPCDPKTESNSAHSAKTLVESGLSAKAIALLQGVVAYFSEDYRTYLEELNAVCEVSEFHPMAFNMLYEGLREGNLIKAATSIHTIEDSFAHEGTPSNAGHAAFGHIPDRPATDPVKYRRMVRAVMAAMIAIRTNLDESLYNKSFRDPYLRSSQKNYQLGIEDLTNGYINNPYVLKTYTEDGFKNPELVRHAVMLFLHKAQKLSEKGDAWINPNFDIDGWMKNNEFANRWIDKGQKAECTFPSIKPEDPQPIFINCILSYIVYQLAEYGQQHNIPTVDLLRARSMIMRYSDERVARVAAPFDSKIKEISEKIAQLKEDSLIKFVRLPKRQNEISTNVKELRTTVQKLQWEKAQAIAPLFDQVLADQIEYGNKDSVVLIHEVIQNFTKGFVPRPLNNVHRMELENEGNSRQLELALRIRNVRQMIKEVFGDYVRFVENDKIWSYPTARHLIQNLPHAMPDILPLSGEIDLSESEDLDARQLSFVLPMPTQVTTSEIERSNSLQKDHKKTNIRYVTYNYNQIDMWVEATLRYMFPRAAAKYFPSDKCTILSVITDPVTQKAISPAIEVKGRDDVYSKFLRVVLDGSLGVCGENVSTNSVTRVLYGKRKFADYVLDFIDTHMLPSEKLDYFKSDRGIQKLFSTEKTIKKFAYWGRLTEKQKSSLVAKMNARKRIDSEPYKNLSDDESQTYSH